MRPVPLCFVFRLFALQNVIGWRANAEILQGNRSVCCFFCQICVFFLKIFCYFNKAFYICTRKNKKKHNYSHYKQKEALFAASLSKQKRYGRKIGSKGA